MVKNKLTVAMIAGASLFIADAASAQWLNSTLDAQRADNLRKHQQRQAQKAAEKQKQPQPKATTPRPLTRAERKAAWSIHEAEYRRRAVRDGYASADRWFEERARAAIANGGQAK